MQPIVGFLFRNGINGVDYYFSEKNGESISQDEKPFLGWNEGLLYIGDVKYVGAVPCILQLWWTASLFSRPGDEWQREQVTFGDQVLQGAIGVEESALSIHLAPKNNQLARFFKQNGDWEGRPINFAPYPEIRTPPFEAVLLNGNWCYLADASTYDNDRPNFIYAHPGGILIEQIADSLVQFNPPCMAASEARVYVGACDPVALNITLFTREAPL